MSATVTGLSVRFGDLTIVDDVSFAVPTAGRLAVMGPSGAGKSTVLRAIAGLEATQAGRIEVDGIDVTSLPAHRRPVGLMFQDYALFPHMTVGENVAYSLRIDGVAARRRYDEASTLLDLVGLSGYAPRSIDALSGGERQRVALARTLAHRPALVLLDEPLGSVDEILKDDLIHQMRRVLDTVGTTAIYVTHDRAEAEAFADRLVIMRSGEIVAAGAPQDLWEDPKGEFVARFMGHRNIVDGTAIGASSGRTLLLPGAVAISDAGDVPGVVVATAFRDGMLRATIAIGGDHVEVPVDVPVPSGASVRVLIDRSLVRPLDAA